MALNLNHSSLKTIHLILASKKWMDMESIGFFYTLYIVYWPFYPAYTSNTEHTLPEPVWRGY